MKGAKKYKYDPRENQKKKAAIAKKQMADARTALREKQQSLEFMRRRVRPVQYSCRIRELISLTQ